MLRRDLFLACLMCLFLVSAHRPLCAQTPLKLLFLGDNGHHRPGDRFHQIAPVLERRGIEVKYTDNQELLNLETLNQFDALIVYANIDQITPSQAASLLEYVSSGNGFIPLHCATYCFRNDQRIVALMGAQFQRHGGEVFSTIIAEPDHPVMRGFGGFQSWDETYVHHLHNERDRTVLEYREQGMQAEGNTREPWTWIRTHGAGRVFYTAWGHDERTWGAPGFHNLLERGIRWACGDDPAQAGDYVELDRFDIPRTTAQQTDVAPFEYTDVGAKIPNYPPSNQWGIQADPLTKMQLPLSAEESIKHYVTPTGFHLELYAAEPDLGGKPIAINWDERGRLWVCETVDYPNALDENNIGPDRIRVCEDTDGDGQADKFTLFADGLSIPSTITFYLGAVIIQNGSETLWLKDDNGDDVADRREVLISNWNMVDTHGGVSNMRYGLDNWFWAMQGYNMSEPIIAATGEKQPGFRMGFWRFQLDDTEPPAVTDIEFIRSTNNNTWGLGISEEGLIFGSTANRNPSVFMPIANRYYEQVRGWGPQQLGTIADTHLFHPITEKVRQVDHHGGYTAGAGHALYTARNYPSQWWNKTAFVCGPTGKLVGTFLLNREGAGFTSTSPLNLIASDDEWAAPIAAEVGPDGNVWVLDWYNYIVQHNPTPHGFETGKGRAYESDLRDKRHGRVYRVVYSADESRPPRQAGDRRLDRASPDELVAALADPTMLVRLHAQRLLVEQGDASVVPDLIKRVRNQSIDAIGLNVGAIHALWTLQGLGAISAADPDVMDAVTGALSHPSAGVRRNAVAVLPQNEQSAHWILGESGVLYDGDAQVRLAVILALAEMPESFEVGTVLAHVLCSPDNLRDRWLRDALTSAGAGHALPFLEGLAEFTSDSDRPSSAISPEVLEVTARVAEHVARGRPERENVMRMIAALENADSAFVAALLEGLARGWPGEYTITLSPMYDQILVSLVDRIPAGATGQLIRLGGFWGSRQLEVHSQKIVASMLMTIRDEQEDSNTRIESAQQLVGFRPNDNEVVSQLLETVTAQAAPDYVAGVIDALTGSTASELGSQLVMQMRALTPAGRQSAVRVLLARPETTVDLLRAAEQGDVLLADLSLDQKHSLSEHPDRSIRRQARRLLEAGGGLPNPDRQRVVEEFMPATQQKGDVALGKELFVKHCSKCHQHGEIGEQIGPNLTGMAVHPKAELLMQILDPSRNVEGNFRSYTVVTVDGRIFTGMMAGESRTSLELIDTEAKKRTLLREDIEQLIASNKSVMPEGFEKQMSPSEMTHLLEFLTVKGKYLPLDLRKVATIASTTPMFWGRSPAERLIFPDWKPKTFKGVPFILVDPQGDRIPNVVMLHGPQGVFPPRMPRQVRLPVNAPATTIHIMGGIGGWSYPAHPAKSTSMIVRLLYADGATEDHRLINGVHFADYIRRVDVTGSEFAFASGDQQIRYLSVKPQRHREIIAAIELIKGDDPTAPIVMAITVETP